jgi:hypothetical protein
LMYYIRAAGGASAKADVSRSYVTQANGKVDAISRRFLLPTYVPQPTPGSTVVVPIKDPTEKATEVLPVVTTVFGLLTTLVTLAIALRR